MMIDDPFAPAAMEPDAETKALLDQMRAAESALPPLETITPEQMREIAKGMGTPPRRDDGVDRIIEGPHGPIPLRILGVHDSPRAVYLSYHGGGWVMGAHDHRDDFLHAFGTQIGAAVVSVGYRLCPEHRFPAPADDCEAAAAWLVSNANEEFGTSEIIIAGESAGAHLAAVTILRMRDRHSFTDFRGADLRYGMYDLRLTPSVRHYAAPGLNRTTLTHLLDFVVDVDQRADPDVSPLIAELHDLPPALFTCGTVDSLIDDSVLMWARWRTAGNPAELALYPGGTHGFDGTPTALGRSAVDRAAAFVDACLAGTLAQQPV